MGDEKFIGKRRRTTSTESNIGALIVTYTFFFFWGGGPYYDYGIIYLIKAPIVVESSTLSPGPLNPMTSLRHDCFSTSSVGTSTGRATEALAWNSRIQNDVLPGFGQRPRLV